MKSKILLDVVALKNGDEKAFERLMDKYYSMLYNFCFGYLHNGDWTKEVLQDVFLWVWENRDKLELQKSIQAFLFSITRNKCLDFIRHRKVVLQFERDLIASHARMELNYHALLDNGLDILLTQELDEAIKKAIDHLPDKARQVFLLSRNKGLKYREIAEELEVSEKTVEAHMRKALSKIRTYLNTHHTELLPADFLLFLLFRK